jgi:hypothetical protein
MGSVHCGRRTAQRAMAGSISFQREVIVLLMGCLRLVVSCLVFAVLCRLNDSLSCLSSIDSRTHSRFPPKVPFERRKTLITYGTGDLEDAKISGY